MNCIVVDDDPIARKLIEQFVGKTPFLELKASFSSSIEAAAFLRKEETDLVFLDIEMPDMTGMEFLASLDKRPLTILVSSKKKYAIEAFDYQVVDYILKPANYPRFLKAATKAYDLFAKESPAQAKENIYLREGNQWVNIKPAGILYVEALGDYAQIITSGEKHTVLTTMKELEQKLPSRKFMRIHRSYIVNLEKISNVGTDSVKIENKLIPIGNTHKEELFTRLNIPL